MREGFRLKEYKVRLLSMEGDLEFHFGLATRPLRQPRQQPFLSKGARSCNNPYLQP
jgi:hypothetical protein